MLPQLCYGKISFIVLVPDSGSGNSADSAGVISVIAPDSCPGRDLDSGVSFLGLKYLE